MKENLKKITPVLLGADLNAYSVAIAFHEAYGVKSHAFGRYKCGLSSYSKIVKIEFCSGYDSIDVILPELIFFAEKNTDTKLFLVPCADCYVEFILKHEEELRKYYSFLVPKEELFEKLTDKASFYKEISRQGIEYPEFTELSEGDNYYKKLSKTEYPAVLKPSVSAEYWRHPFPGMRKVYYPESADEAASIIGEFRYYGYRDGIVLQKKIENPEHYVYTGLWNKKSECDFGVFGRVALEERGKTSEGNHSAIFTEEKNELCKRLDKFLESLGYVGFANFDILKSDGKFYVLELNARQGRSCDYIRAAGINIAERLVSAITSEVNFLDENYKKIFWHYPPFKLASEYMTRKNSEKALYFKKAGLAFSPLNYRGDIFANPVRFGYVTLHGHRLRKAYCKDFGERKA